MALEKPTNPKDLRFFTRKTVGSGKAMLWVFNPRCSKCKDGYLAVPYDESTGRFKSRAKTVKCNKCGAEAPKTELKEAEAIVNVAYTCPFCGKEGELQAPFKRTAKKAFKFRCIFCGKEIKVE